MEWPRRQLSWTWSGNLSFREASRTKRSSLTILPSFVASFLPSFVASLLASFLPASTPETETRKKFQKKNGIPYWNHLAVLSGWQSTMNTFFERTLGCAFGKNPRTKNSVVGRFCGFVQWPWRFTLTARIALVHTWPLHTAGFLCFKRRVDLSRF